MQNFVIMDKLFTSMLMMLIIYEDRLVGISVTTTQLHNDLNCRLQFANTPNKLMELLGDDPCFLSLLLKRFKKSVLIITNSNKDNDISMEMLQCQGSENTDVFNLQDPMNSTTIAKGLELILESNFEAFLLLCSAECTANFIEMAGYLSSFTAMSHLWVIFHPEIFYAVQEFPSNVIAIKLIPTCMSSRLVSNSSSFKHEDFIGILAVWESELPLQWQVIGKYDRFDNEFAIVHPQHELLSYLNKADGQKVFNVVTVIESPFTMIHRAKTVYDETEKQCFSGKLCWVPKVTKGNKTFVPKCCYGYCMDLLDRIELDLKIDTRVYIVEDGQYGAKVNNTWVGMVGDLVSGKADLIFAALTITEQRSEVIDFSDPYLVGGVGIAVLVEKQALPFFNTEAFSPLSTTLWLTVLSIPVFATVVLTFAENLLQEENKRQYLWFHTFVFLVGLMFQRELSNHMPHLRLSSGIIVVTVSVFMLVIMTTYTAVLTANTVTHKNSLPITGFNDKKVTNPSPAFTYGTIQNSAFTQMFHDSKDPDWNRMYYFMRDYNFKTTPLAFELLKKGKLNGIIHDYPVIFYYIAKESDCSIQFAGPPIQDAGYGLAVKKGSLLKAKLSELIRNYKTFGTLAALRKKWINSKCIKDELESEYTKLGLNYFGGLFVLMCCSILLGLFIFIGEFLISNQVKAKTFKMAARGVPMSSVTWSTDYDFSK